MKYTSRKNILLSILPLFLMVSLLFSFFIAGNSSLDFLLHGTKYIEYSPADLLELDLPRKTYGGHDGQFYSYLLLDPLLKKKETAAFLDLPQYRSRKIGTVALLSLLPVSIKTKFYLYSCFNLILWFCFYALLLKFVKPRKVKDFLLIYILLFNSSILVSVFRSMTDFPAMFFSLIPLLSSGRIMYLFFSYAMLFKEATILSSISYLRKFFDFKKIRILFVCFIPAFCWWVYSYNSFEINNSAIGPTYNFSLPFYHLSIAILNDLKQLLTGNMAGLIDVLAHISMVIQSIYLVMHRKFRCQFWRFGILFVPLYFMLGGPVQVEMQSFARVLLPLIVSFNLSIWKHEKRFIKWFIMGNIGLLSEYAYQWYCLFK